MAAAAGRAMVVRAGERRRRRTKRKRLSPGPDDGPPTIAQPIPGDAVLAVPYRCSPRSSGILCCLFLQFQASLGLVLSLSIMSGSCLSEAGGCRGQGTDRRAVTATPRVVLVAAIGSCFPEIVAPAVPSICLYHEPLLDSTIREAGSFVKPGCLAAFLAPS